MPSGKNEQFALASIVLVTLCCSVPAKCTTSGLVELGAFNSADEQEYHGLQGKFQYKSEFSKSLMNRCFIILMNEAKPLVTVYPRRTRR